MHKLISKDAIESTEIVKFDQYITKEETMEIDGEKIQLVPVGQSHSKYDVFIYMPDRKVLFAGDLVMNGRITSNRDSLVIGQLKALERMKSYDWNVLLLLKVM